MIHTFRYMKCTLLVFIVGWMVLIPNISIAQSFCESDFYSDKRACESACPSYCESDFYSDEMACKGCKPSYCESDFYSDKMACGRK